MMPGQILQIFIETNKQKKPPGIWRVLKLSLFNCDRLKYSYSLYFLRGAIFKLINQMILCDLLQFHYELLTLQHDMVACLL